MPGPLPQLPKPLAEPHFVMPGAPSTTPCEQLGADIAAVEGRLEWTEQAIRHADQQRAMADAKASDAHKAHNQAEYELWRGYGDDMLRQREQLHDEQERLRKWLNEAKSQQATRCYRPTSTATSSGAQVAGGGIKKVAIAVGGMVASAALIGYLMAPAKAEPTPLVDPTPAVQKDTPAPPKAQQPKGGVMIQLKAVDADGGEVGGGHFRVKTTSKLTPNSGAKAVEDPGGKTLVMVEKDWQGVVEYDPPEGWVVVGSDPSGGEVRVQGGAVDNGFGQPLVRHSNLDGTFTYEVIFQVRRKVMPHQPKKPADGPIGDPSDKGHYPDDGIPRPTTPIGGSQPGKTSTGSSSSTGSRSSSCTSTGSSTYCSSDTGGQHESNDSEPARTEEPREDEGQYTDTYVGEPQVSGGEATGSDEEMQRREQLG